MIFYKAFFECVGKKSHICITCILFTKIMVFAGRMRLAVERFIKFKDLGE